MPDVNPYAIQDPIADMIPSQQVNPNAINIQARVPQPAQMSQSTQFMSPEQVMDRGIPQPNQPKFLPVASKEIQDLRDKGAQKAYQNIIDHNKHVAKIKRGSMIGNLALGALGIGGAFTGMPFLTLGAAGALGGLNAGAKGAKAQEDAQYQDSIKLVKEFNDMANGDTLEPLKENAKISQKYVDQLLEGYEKARLTEGQKNKEAAQNYHAKQIDRQIDEHKAHDAVLEKIGLGHLAETQWFNENVVPQQEERANNNQEIAAINMIANLGKGTATDAREVANLYKRNREITNKLTEHVNTYNEKMRFERAKAMAKLKPGESLSPDLEEAFREKGFDSEGYIKFLDSQIPAQQPNPNLQQAQTRSQALIGKIGSLTTPSHQNIQQQEPRKESLADFPVKGGTARPLSTWAVKDWEQPTELSPEEEKEYQAGVQSGQYPSTDEGFNGKAYYKGIKSGLLEPGTGANEQGEQHWKDYGKTAVNKGFSSDSSYATPDAPKWHQSEEASFTVDADGRKRAIQWNGNFVDKVQNAFQIQVKKSGDQKATQVMIQWAQKKFALTFQQAKELVDRVKGKEVSENE